MFNQNDPEKAEEALKEALEQFEDQAPRLILRSKRAELKKLYSRLTATASLPGGSRSAIKMRHTLKDALLATSRKLRRGIFDDL